MSSDLKTAQHSEFADPSIKEGGVDDGAVIPTVPPVLCEETNRKLLRKIDMRLMPVVRICSDNDIVIGEDKLTLA